MDRLNDQTCIYCNNFKLQAFIHQKFPSKYSLRYSSSWDLAEAIG